MSRRGRLAKFEEWQRSLPFASLLLLSLGGVGGRAESEARPELMAAMID